jgi:hypothetical protein
LVYDALIVSEVFSRCPRPKEIPDTSLYSVVRPKKHNSLCPNSLVSVGKDNTHEWKSNIFIAFLNNHSY